MKSVRLFLRKALTSVLGILLAVGLMPTNLASAAKPTTFNHIDIRSAASFTYHIDGVDQKVDIDFRQSNEQLDNIKLYRRNRDGTKTNIPVSGSWRQDGGEWEYSIKGNFARYYDNGSSQTQENEVRYFTEFTLNVKIAGNDETLIFVGEDYTYSSKNNVCPGSESYGTKGIDMRIKGEDLTQYFSMTTISVKKEWAGSATTLPSSVTIALLRDGVNTGKTLNLTADKGWRGIFTGLQKIDPINGHEYTYTVVETSINGVALNGHELIVREGTNGPILGKWSAAASGTTVTNAWIPATETEDATTTSFKIQKINDIGKKIDGAEFTLEKDGNTQTAVLENGEFVFTGLTAGTYVLTEVKAPTDYAPMTSPITVTVTVDKQLVSANEETLVNTYHNEFAIDFDGAGDWVQEEGVLVIKNYLKTTSLSVTKIWADENKKAESVTVQLYQNGKAVDGETVKLDMGNNWSYTWNTLRESMNGVKIDYEVKEIAVFGADEGFIVYGTELTNEGKAEVEGRWDAVEEGSNGGKIWTVTNSWVASSREFIGAPKFYIQKVDQTGAPLRMAGIKFVVTSNNNFAREVVTDDEGRIEIANLPADVNFWDEEYVYSITELEPAQGYNLARGFAELKITSNKGKLINVSGLVNTFEKRFIFTASGSDDYSWDAMTNTFVVTNVIIDPCAHGGCGGGSEDDVDETDTVIKIPKAPDTGVVMSGIATDMAVVVGVEYEDRWDAEWGDEIGDELSGDELSGDGAGGESSGDGAGGDQEVTSGSTVAMKDTLGMFIAAIGLAVFILLIGAVKFSKQK